MEYIYIIAALVFESTKSNRIVNGSNNQWKLGLFSVTTEMELWEGMDDIL